ncbi:SGNH/GDSL hydrolase family protein [Leifsonia sp. C5G2]|uniref:SGNH/GDSL hydrolase family protein n=1 Tax=Leifsonia sp. C5G2 TaxID=2735269 RepID=UPI0018459076|nr:SGNH/GDSL hydrolase family protein [Leifsonia sp. C5G2]
MTNRRPRHLLATALLAGALVLSTAGCTATGGQAAQPTATATATAEPRPVTAAAIGDSIAIGYGVPADDAWPLLVARRLGWNLTDLADSASGFTRKGGSSHTFDDQVSAVIRLRPEIVIVAATRNDVDAPPATLAAAATSALERLRAALPDTRIIGVSPIWGADTPTPQVGTVRAAVRAAVLDVRGSWVDLGQPFTGHPELLIDGKHPTVAGQQQVATAVADKVAALLSRE